MNPPTCYVQTMSDSDRKEAIRIAQRNRGSDGYVEQDYRIGYCMAAAPERDGMCLRHQAIATAAGFRYVERGHVHRSRFTLLTSWNGGYLSTRLLESFARGVRLAVEYGRITGNAGVVAGRRQYDKAAQ